MNGLNGNLPRGWGEATLGELGVWSGGGTPSKRNPAYWNDGEIPWVSPKDMGEMVLRGTEDHITRLAADESSRIANLTAGLGVERRLVENDAALLALGQKIDTRFTVEHRHDRGFR